MNVVKSLHTVLRHIFLLNINEAVNVPRIEEVINYLDKNIKVYEKLDDNTNILLYHLKEIIIYIVIFHIKNQYIENYYDSDLLVNFIIPFLLYIRIVQFIYISPKVIRLIPTFFFRKLKESIIKRTWMPSISFLHDSYEAMILKECKKVIDQRLKIETIL